MGSVTHTRENSLTFLHLLRPFILCQHLLDGEELPRLSPASCVCFDHPTPKPCGLCVFTICPSACCRLLCEERRVSKVSMLPAHCHSNRLSSRLLPARVGFLGCGVGRGRWHFHTASWLSVPLGHSAVCVFLPGHPLEGCMVGDQGEVAPR